MLSVSLNNLQISEMVCKKVAYMMENKSLKGENFILHYTTLTYQSIIFNRKLFNTTLRLDIAINALAHIGVS